MSAHAQEFKMWESPIYRFQIEINGSLTEILIDVTGSAPPMQEPKKQLTNTFEMLLRDLRPSETRILDFGGAKLRNTLYLLKKGYHVYACEFQDLFERMKQAHDNLELCKEFPNFHNLVFPKQFIEFDDKFDVVLLINVLNIMPVPIERYCVLNLCREKMNGEGRLLWYTQHGYKPPYVALLNDGKVTGKSRTKYHMFYADWSKEEIHDMLAATGFSLNEEYRLSRVSGGNQAYIFRPDMKNLVDKALGLTKRIRMDVKREFSVVSRDAWKRRETYDARIPIEVTELEDVNLLDAYSQELDEIPTGERDSSKRNQYARKYHWLIFNILKIIFRNRLKRPQMEESIAADTQKVDITFSNKREFGFFKHLHEGYGIMCPNIFVECKNLKDDIKNPEFAQIQSRLSSSKGLFGIIVCREIVDKDRAKLRQDNIFKDGKKCVITLTDSDIKEIITFKIMGEESEIDNYLDDKLKEIIM